jgi:hypothetical protein
MRFRCKFNFQITKFRAFDYNFHYRKFDGADYLMPIFLIDFVLNFLKIQSLDTGYLADPLSIAAHYLK